MVKRSLWGGAHKASRLHQSPNASTRCGEIDLREEFDRILFGGEGCTPHGVLLAVRHLRRETDGSPIPCVCKDKFTGEAEPGCSYCSGESYLWDEEWYIARSQYLGSDGGKGSRYRFTPAGETRSDTKVFFFRYNVPLKYGDKVVEMKLDIEGYPVTPYIREAIYKPQTIDFKRSDNGRVEYIAVSCLEKDALRSDVR